MNATNAKRFAEVYAVKLTEAIARHPDEYAFEATPDAIAAVVAKMVPAYGSIVISGVRDKRTVRIVIPVGHKSREGSDHADQLRSYFQLPPTPRSRMY